MTKAHAPRRRHILFEVKGSVSEVELKAAIYREALKFFGEYGCSYAQLKLTEYNAAGKTGILTCSRDYADKVPGFLALIQAPRIITKRTSGTIKKLKEKEKIRIG